MKIDELIKKANQKPGFRAGCYDNYISITSKDRPLDDFIFSFSKDVQSYSDVDYDLGCLPDDYLNEDLFDVFNLIHDYIKTPVKERFSEKRYRLRWIDDCDGSTNYLDLAGAWALYTTKPAARTFTEKELQQLKINNPRFAPAIDAMKEPVEDD